MERTLKPARMTFLLFLLLSVAAVLIVNLYDLSVIEAEEYLVSSPGSVASETTVAAARGSILDRNGVLLASDKTVYNVTIDRRTLLKTEDPNGTVLKLIRAAEENGIRYTDTFPVTMSAPFAYSANMTESQQGRLKQYLNYSYFKLKEDISATDLITWMRNHYGIDYTVTAEDARLIIGVRYELELRAIAYYRDYVFAEDVSTDFITYIKEQRLAAVSVTAASRRQYHTAYASHILGNMGYISKEYLEEHEGEGYTLNSIIGLNGAEGAFEAYLRGHDGTVVTYRDYSGAVTDVVVKEPARAGSNVYLTIDIELNRVCEEALASTISAINLARQTEAAEKAAREGTDAEKVELSEGGAVVVMDVNTADVIAAASYPDYHISNWNRATQGLYEPGSTFKMITALAALNTGTITPQTTIHDESVYTEYQELGFAPRCWIYPYSHGNVNVVSALENSCNYFFYTVSDRMGIDPIASMASQFGLGAKTGVELGEAAGILASREYKRDVLGEGWWNADTLLASIGQSYNQFTPIQIANYIATIANGGTHYEASILKYITSADYSDILLEKEPTVLNVIDDHDGYFPVIQRGMRAVAATGTASSEFADFPIKVAAKTGTVQSDTAAMNTGVFVCYAPADDPQIAIAVVVEKGGSGSALTTIASDILTAYFSESREAQSVVQENALVK